MPPVTVLGPLVARHGRQVEFLRRPRAATAGESLLAAAAGAALAKPCANWVMGDLAARLVRLGAALSVPPRKARGWRPPLKSTAWSAMARAWSA